MNIYTYTHQGQLTDHIIGGIRKGEGGGGWWWCPDSCIHSFMYQKPAIHNKLTLTGNYVPLERTHYTVSQ